MSYDKTSWYLLFFAWIVATVATLGSLFFSEVMEFIPCTMCWYQRICMYPLAIILLIALLRNDKKALFYAAPLAVIGWGWAFYHTLLVFEVISEEMTPCSFGVPCSVSYIKWFGFIDIPLLSLFAFTLIAISLSILYKKGVAK